MTADLIYERFLRDCEEHDLWLYRIDECEDISALIDAIVQQSPGWTRLVKKAQKRFYSADVLWNFVHKCEDVATLERREYLTLIAA